MNLVPIGEICDLRNGRAFKPTEWSTSGTPIIRIQNLTDETKPFNYCDFEVDTKFHVESGNLLFSWSGTPGTSFGAFFWRRDHGYLNQHIFRIDPHSPKELNLEYFRLALNQKLVEIISQAHGGVGLQHITKEKLNKIKVYLPELIDQIRIAHLLGKVEGLIAQRKQHLHQLDDLLKSVFLEMFGDPVRNEKGWDRLPLEKLGSLNRGVSKHRPRNAPDLLGGKYPLIQTGEVSNAGTYINTFSHTYSDIGFAQSKLWPSGTLCITIAANIAQTGILTFDACFPDSVVGFSAFENETHVLYVHGLFWFFQKILEKNAPAAAQKNINLEILRGMEVPKPPIELQAQFASMVEKIEGIKSRYQKNLNDLEDLYGALNQQAFKGELDLSRVPLPGVQPEEQKIVAAEPLHLPAEQVMAIDLSDISALHDVVQGPVRQQDILRFWLEAYLGQLGNTPFSVQRFMAAAQTRLAELHPDNDFELGANDYEHIKTWVFDALDGGALTQACDGAGNRVELKAAFEKSPA